MVVFLHYVMRTVNFSIYVHTPGWHCESGDNELRADGTNMLSVLRRHRLATALSLSGCAELLFFSRDVFAGWIGMKVIWGFKVFKWLQIIQKSPGESACWNEKNRRRIGSIEMFAFATSNILQKIHVQTHFLVLDSFLTTSHFPLPFNHHPDIDHNQCRCVK